MISDQIIGLMNERKLLYVSQYVNLRLIKSTLVLLSVITKLFLNLFD